MSQIARYCENCGQPLGATARFCGRCGRPVAPLAAPEPVHQPTGQPANQEAILANRPASAPLADDQAILANRPTAEVVMGVIPGATRGKGFLGLSRTAYVIVVTDHRLIFATQTNAMMKENIRRARAEAKAEGKGFFGQWGAQMGANFGRHYQQMAPAQILAEHPENFFILPNQVQEVRIGEDDSDDGPTTYKMRLKTHAEKIDFTFQWLDARAARQLLGQLLGAGVRIR